MFGVVNFFSTIHAPLLTLSLMMQRTISQRVPSPHTNVPSKSDFRSLDCREGVLYVIERLTHAGGTPELHSEVQKQVAVGIRRIDVLEQTA
jgi:hypothetical protein